MTLTDGEITALEGMDDHALVELWDTCKEAEDLNKQARQRAEYVLLRRMIERKADELKPFKTFLGGTVPRCGQIRDAQRDFLFHDDASEIGSAALVPLAKSAEIGFLAIGSNDTRRFHPGMSIDFLTRLGDLVAGALRRY